MLHIAEKSLSSCCPWVARLLVNFLCCSFCVCKSFCQFTWQCDCELLFPVPSGAFPTGGQWDELLYLLFLLSLSGNLISRQIWYTLFAYLFENIVYDKANNDALQIRLRRRHRKFLRRRRARIARERYTAAIRLKVRQILARRFDSTLGFPGEG